MAIFQVDSEQVSLAAATADQSSATIQAEVAQMMTFLRGLEATWGGAASASFQGVIEQWQAAQAQVEDALRSISTQLHSASQTYVDAETMATAMFTS